MTQRGQCPGKLSGFLKPRTFGPTFWKRAQQKCGWTQCLGECGSAAGHGKHPVTKGWTGGERRGHVWKRDTGQRCAHARLPGLRTGKDLVAAARPITPTTKSKQRKRPEFGTQRSRSRLTSFPPLALVIFVFIGIRVWSP